MRADVKSASGEVKADTLRRIARKSFLSLLREGSREDLAVVFAPRFGDLPDEVNERFTKRAKDLGQLRGRVTGLVLVEKGIVGMGAGAVAGSLLLLEVDRRLKPGGEGRIVRCTACLNPSVLGQNGDSRELRYKGNR